MLPDPKKPAPLDDLHLEDEESAAAYQKVMERKRQEAQNSPKTEEPAAKQQEPTEPARATAQQRKLDGIHKTGNLIAWIAAPLVLGGFLYAQLMHGGNSGGPLREPDLPITGSLLEVSEATSGWKKRTEEDRVTGVIEMLTRKQVYPSRIPSVKLKINGKSGTSYLRLLFMDTEGNIAGDPRLVKIENGALSAANPGSNAEMLGDGRVQITGSAGFIDRAYLDDYLCSKHPRWKVEISESSNYQARGQDWKVLQTFEISNHEIEGS
jgi:hypothetical protein